MQFHAVSGEKVAVHEIQKQIQSPKYDRYFSNRSTFQKYGHTNHSILYNYKIYCISPVNSSVRSSNRRRKKPNIQEGKNELFLHNFI